MENLETFLQFQRCNGTNLNVRDFVRKVTQQLAQFILNLCTSYCRSSQTARSSQAFPSKLSSPDTSGSQDQKMKLSGIQKDVVHFYRKCIRACFKKDLGVRNDFVRFTRTEFIKFKDLKRKDITTIEYLLRTGNRKLEMFSNPSLRKIN